MKTKASRKQVRRYCLKDKLSSLKQHLGGRLKTVPIWFSDGLFYGKSLNNPAKSGIIAPYFAVCASRAFSDGLSGRLLFRLKKRP